MVHWKFQKLLPNSQGELEYRNGKQNLYNLSGSDDYDGCIRKWA